MLMMVRATGQSEAHPARRHTVVARPPGPVPLSETEILQRAAHHFRLRTTGDLEAVVGAGSATAPIAIATGSPSADGGAAAPRPAFGNGP